MWIKYLPYILGVLAILGVLSFAGYKVYDYGVTVTTLKYEKIISDVNTASAALLEKQKAEHDRFVEAQDKIVNNIKSENNRLIAIQKENESEANKDPNAQRPAVSKSSVMRLNKFR
jgi:hypothetical protein